MSARWYRSPELCLNLDTYDSKIDIWAIGCIFHELQSILVDTPQKEKSNVHRVLFQGTSCYPLSPNHNEKGEIEVTKNDQLVKILKTLGVEQENQFDFIDEESMKYVEKIVHQYSFKGLEKTTQKKFKNIRSDHLETIENSLLFNPTERHSAKNLLKNPAFDKIRVEENELAASQKIYLTDKVFITSIT